MAFPEEAAACSAEEPETTVLEFGDHAFECPLGHAESAVEFPCLTFLARDAYALELIGEGEPIVARL